ncbi:hypothetical protein [Ferdinandcohnia sp. Marseille-Q9671]
MKSKALLLLGAVVVGGSLVVGFTQVDAPPTEAKEESTSNQIVVKPKGNVVEAAEVDPKQWEDATNIPEGLVPDFPTNVNGYFEHTLKNWYLEADEKLLQAGYPPEYDYYIKAMAITNVVDEYIRVQGVDFERDLYNLRMLAAVIEREQWKRTSHINFNPEDPNRDKFETTREAVAHWKPATERYNQAVEYTKQLLNDINYIANGTGEPFGVTNQLDGDKVDELNSFLDVERDIIEDYINYY